MPDAWNVIIDEGWREVLRAMGPDLTAIEWAAKIGCSPMTVYNATYADPRIRYKPAAYVGSRGVRRPSRAKP